MLHASALAACLALAAPSAGAATVTFTNTAAAGSYTVPAGVNRITIISRGADGGVATATATSNGGQGATVTTVIDVAPGDVVRFVVGAAGASGDLESGGGGGTGVFVNGVLAMVAGGGGGEDNTGNGDGGLAGIDGSAGGANAGVAGTGGQGGGGGNANGTAPIAGDGGAGGGGILSAGQTVASAGGSLTTGGGQADTNLGDGLSVSPGGTSNQTTDPSGADGLGAAGGSGFGGGGAASHRESGAGGGYSGGGGGGSSGKPGGGGSYRNTTIAGYVSGTTTAGTVGGGTGANGFVSISYIDPTITVSKQAIGGTGTFAFSGTNGFTSHNVIVGTAGATVAGPTRTLTNPGVSTVLTEGAPPAGFTLTGVNCSGLGSGGTANVNLVARTVTLDPAATVSGSAIACTFVNTFSARNFQLTKTQTSGPSPITAAGQVIGYTIQVQNTGTQPLTGVAITNDTISTGAGTSTLTPAYASGDINGNSIMEITETWAYNVSYTVTQADVNAGGTIANSVTVSTTQVGPRTATSGATPVTRNPQLTVVKSANSAGPAAVGQVITYTFRVTNTGNVTVTGVGVNESFNGYGIPPNPANEALSNDAAPTGDSIDAAANNGSWSTLAPGDQVTFTAPYTVVQQDIDSLQ
jgi:uncharacterized repeat protein (TIGR01451 family)